MSGLILLACAVTYSHAVDRSWATTQGGFSKTNYVLPPDVQSQGIAFAGIAIPIDRRDVWSRVMDQMNFLLMDRRASIMECFDRMAVYGPIMGQILQEEKVPPDLLYLAVLLSDFLPNSKTRTGGVGWWALGSVKDKKDPANSPWVVTNDWDDRRDPVLSTKIACNILQGILKRPNVGDWLLAICSYTDGLDKVEAVLGKARGYSYWDLVMPPFSEAFIPRLVAFKIIDTHRDFYGVAVSPLPPLAFDSLDRLKLLKELPLHLVAKWSGTSPRAIWELNPGVDPSVGVLPVPDKRSQSGFPLRVPKGMGGKVKQNLVSEGFVSKL